MNELHPPPPILDISGAEIWELEIQILNNWLVAALRLEPGCPGLVRINDFLRPGPRACFCHALMPKGSKDVT